MSKNLTQVRRLSVKRPSILNAVSRRQTDDTVDMGGKDDLLKLGGLGEIAEDGQGAKPDSRLRLGTTPGPKRMTADEFAE